MLSFGMSIKGNFSPSTQVHCYQIKGPSEEEYNDALGADDEEVILSKTQIQSVGKTHFDS